MSQQIDESIALNQMLNECITKNPEINGSVGDIDLSANISVKDITYIQNSLECNVRIGDQNCVENSTESKVTINGQMDDTSVSKTVIEVAVQSEDESNDKTTDEPTLQLDSEPECSTNSELKPESSTETSAEPTVDSISAKMDPKTESTDKSAKYNRKTSSESLIKIWKMIESKEWHKSEDQLNQWLSKKMLNLFNIKLNDNKIGQMMETAISEKLVIREELNNQIRYVANTDPKLFGELTNDWFCFECHIGDQLIGCGKCFKAFHMHCLKGEQKDQKNSECFECVYCRRSAQPDLNDRVDRLSKPELNKCVYFVINNLRVSNDLQLFESLQTPDSSEQTEQNQVLLFKPMDVLMIRDKAADNQYNRLEEAIIDFKHFQHNFIIMKRGEAVALKDFERRFNHEIKELKLCVDCYKYSSDISYDIEDDPHDWFTLVCDPPHELVFAKFGKYPFWPAKVIEIKTGGKQYDVRFFDAPDFSRAIVPLQRLRPIEGFHIEDEDNELELPVQLMEKHIKKMRAKGLYFMPTIVNPEKRSAKKRPNTDSSSKSDRPFKRSKKTVE